MGTSNKLLQTALREWTHNSRQPEAAIVTYHHTVGDNGLGLNWPRHHYQIVQEVLYHSMSNDLDGTEDDVLWAEQYVKSGSTPGGFIGPVWAHDWWNFEFNVQLHFS